MNDQLSFDLPVRVAFGREDFFVSDANAIAVAMVEAPQTWPQGKLVLQGPKGSGKSHLLDIWCAKFGADHWSPTSATLPPAGAKIGIDDVDKFASDKDAQDQLFHLHNHLLATDGALLFTTTSPISQAGFTLPDLQSRLMGTAVTRIDAPNDALLDAIIVKHFMDRQIAVSPQVLTYISRHTERSFSAVANLVKDLDSRSMAKGTKITRSMVADVLRETY